MLSDIIPRKPLSCFSGDCSYKTMKSHLEIVNKDAPVLVTGAGGFIGARVVSSLLDYGFRNVRCLVRSTSNRERLNAVVEHAGNDRVQIVCGNLLSPTDCEILVRDVAVIFHLSAGTGKSFPGCYLNSVVATRNLLAAAASERALKRFVNVSSFSVYSNYQAGSGFVLDETCPLEANMLDRCDAYGYGKLKQEELVANHAARYELPYVTVRPGLVFGPGKAAIPSQAGVSTFGFFMHLGGGNQLPLTYVDNCAEAIILAGVTAGIDGETFNVVDDDLPSSRKFMACYRRAVGPIRSVPVPYSLYYCFCWFWEWYAAWSKGQLPPVLNRRYCAFYWKRQHYSNAKMKVRLGWEPRINMQDAMERYFEYQRKEGADRD